MFQCYQVWEFPIEKLEPDFMDVKIMQFFPIVYFSLLWGVFVQFYTHFQLFNHLQTVMCVLMPL